MLNMCVMLVLTLNVKKLLKCYEMILTMII